MPKNQAIRAAGHFGTPKQPHHTQTTACRFRHQPLKPCSLSLHRTCSNLRTRYHTIQNSNKMSWQGMAAAIPSHLGPLLNPHLGAAVVKLTLSQLMSTPGNDSASPQAPNTTRGQFRVLIFVAASSAPVMWTRALSSALPATVPGLPLPASRYGITPPFPGMRPCYAHHPSSSPLHTDPGRSHAAWCS